MVMQSFHTQVLVYMYKMSYGRFNVRALPARKVVSLIEKHSLYFAAHKVMRSFRGVNASSSIYRYYTSTYR